MAQKYSLGLDYGTNSVRALLVNTNNGREVTTYVHNYKRGVDGIILDRKNHNLARQDPQDYVESMEICIKQVINQTKKKIKNFSSGEIIGIGVDTTGSTPIPVDEKGQPLSFRKEFRNNPNAMAWLWKDHTGYEEAEEITELAKKRNEPYLAKCGGVYSSEWFFSKILHCLRTDSKVFESAYSWVELADFIPGLLTGKQSPAELKRSVCAAGHKAMYNPQWGGLPSKEFLSELDPRLAELRDNLYTKAYSADVQAGKISPENAKKFGLREDVAISVGAFDAHMGAVGAGIKPGVLVKILGTSTCDMMVVPNKERLSDIPGLCGIVDGSILPGYFGLEAGQSAVGDIFNWFTKNFIPKEYKVDVHRLLSQKMSKLRPGESGLLALDWNNGNRTILVDAKLTGLILGQTLHTTPEEIYRALIEATAFGAKVIINRFEEYGVKVEEIVNCGGIAEKNRLLMQIYADILGRPMKISRSAQTCALGAAIFGAVAAGKSMGGYETVESAQSAMCGLKDTVYRPNQKNRKTYEELFTLYRQLHDIFGTRGSSYNLFNVMKDLLKIRDTSH
ncbi:MAG: ribulokinase [Elusimicrobia bacterium CG1_02_37_114]|nr:MAG: ribulokinase [Elusimicrobia bacterium CG1_02_37_114]PIV54170.1 MAG: ribulokinase [Elusimicrobia bacterium CG02_land_8_20_14_3_00_37_13]